MAWEYFYLFIDSVYFFPIHLLPPCRRVFVLAATLWQYVLPPRSSASLYDPTDDERVLES